MITNNFKKAIQLLMTSDMYNGFGNAMEFVDYNGNKQSVKWICASGIQDVPRAFSFHFIMNTFSKVNNYSGNGVYFGNGEKQATENDYKLDGTILNDKLEVMKTITAENDGDIRKIVGVYTLRNTSDSEITIREVGSVGFIYGNNGGNSYALYDRTLLDEPLTLAPGEIGEITYTIENTLQHSTATAQ